MEKGSMGLAILAPLITHVRANYLTRSLIWRATASNVSLVRTVRTGVNKLIIILKCIRVVESSHAFGWSFRQVPTGYRLRITQMVLSNRT